jgi:hypothetical protein
MLLRLKSSVFCEVIPLALLEVQFCWTTRRHIPEGSTRTGTASRTSNPTSLRFVHNYFLKLLKYILNHSYNFLGITRFLFTSREPQNKGAYEPLI